MKLESNRLWPGFLAVFGALVFSLPSTANAQEPPVIPGMRFAVVRSAAPGCEPSCPQWISAEGKIDWTTPNKFRMFLEKLGKRRFPVLIHSPGGDVRAAMILGRMIRQAKLDVGVAQTRFEGCAPEAAGCKPDKAGKRVYAGTAVTSFARCHSACTFTLASGARRLAGNAFVGVHEITRTMYKREVIYKTEYAIVNGKKKAVGKRVAGSKELGEYQSNNIPGNVRKAITDYFREMGVKEQFLDVMLSVPATEIRQLDMAQMLELKLLTGKDGAEQISNPQICAGQPPSENCVTVSAASKAN